MAVAIDNLVEVMDKPEELYKQLKNRETKLEEYRGFGPGDLCYFVKEEKGGLFQAAKTAGYFHIVYGADTASAAAVAAYINDTLRMSQVEYLDHNMRVAFGPPSLRSRSIAPSFASTTWSPALTSALILTSPASSRCTQ
jgi:hypothetical protein